MNFPIALTSAAVVSIVGLYFNYKGRHFSSDQQAALQEAVGLLCQAIAGVIVWAQNLHKANVALIKNLYAKQGTVPPLELVKTHEQRRQLMRIVPLLALAFILQGCASLSPATNLSNAELAFTGLQSGLQIAHQAGAMDDKTWSVIQNGFVKGNAALDSLDIQVASGVITTNQQLYNAVGWVTLKAVMDELASLEQAVATNGPSTRPSDSTSRLSAVRQPRSQLRKTASRVYPARTRCYYRSAA